MICHFEQYHIGKKTIDDIYKDILYLIFYFQGEPYLNPQFLEMVKYANRKGIYTATSTNAHYLTDENARIATLSMNFLTAGKKYEATIYRDAADAHYDNNPEAYLIEKKIIDQKTVLTIPVAAGGGFAIRLKQL